MSSYTDSLISLSSRGCIQTVISTNPLRDFVQYSTSVHPCNTAVSLRRMNPALSDSTACAMKSLYFQCISQRLQEQMKTNKIGDGKHVPDKNTGQGPNSLPQRY